MTGSSISRECYLTYRAKEKNRTLFKFGSSIRSLGFFNALFYCCILYPGGSHIDQHARGFSWGNNYWGNLLNKTAIDGEQNPGRLVALVATFFLCVALAVFWYRFPRQMNQKEENRFADSVFRNILHGAVDLPD
jgi:hypothetical protein